ncbi:DUF3040 domain-containing protein [Amycolatopsis benzoatilytica]|uniref:DUF3040 domain-containing protein n=1 Tax=Amycolatopsis benzoatilytica TaxID=346045 RepID=UPI00036A62F0|nr:DUF3040 domain-containing protein [Amycolatopsis benzoatilytica]
MRTRQTPDTAHALRSIERDLRFTDARWVRRAFGQSAWPLRRTWPAACWTLTAAAASLVGFGVARPAFLPLALLGFVLAAVALCGHLTRQEALHPPPRRTPLPGPGTDPRRPGCRPSPR